MNKLLAKKYHIKIKLILAIFFWQSLCAENLYAASINHYHVIFETGEARISGSGKVNAVAIRSFKKDGKNYYLAVKPDTMDTVVLAQNRFNRKCIALQDSHYFKLLAKDYSAANYLAKGGLSQATHALPSQRILTIDLCPSHKSLNKKLFDLLQQKAQNQTSPMPVAISVSGLWIKHHGQEFKYLKQLDPRLQISWVNHSFTHPYIKSLPIRKNFLLMHPKQFENEVLRNEILLLERGQTPSILFRFPGLIADSNLMDRLKKLHLLPLGSNAWLAKDEPAHDGSVILVHANGNEPKGIEKLFPLLGDAKLTWISVNNIDA